MVRRTLWEFRISWFRICIVIQRREQITRSTGIWGRCNTRDCGNLWDWDSDSVLFIRWIANFFHSSLANLQTFLLCVPPMILQRDLLFLCNPNMYTKTAATDTNGFSPTCAVRAVRPLSGLREPQRVVFQWRNVAVYRNHRTGGPGVTSEILVYYICDKAAFPARHQIWMTQIWAMPRYKFQAVPLTQ